MYLPRLSHTLDGYAASPFDGRPQSRIVEFRLGKRKRSDAIAFASLNLSAFAAVERAVNPLRRFLPSSSA